MSENLSIERKENYAILYMHHGKGNLQNSAFLNEIMVALDELEKDSNVLGIVIAGQPGAFSFGLHVKEMVKLSKEGMVRLGSSISKTNYKMVTFPKPVVAAITGHAPAGGTVIASGADYRVMADDAKYVIGLNEVGANLPIPLDIAHGLIFWIGEGKAYHYVLEGKLMNPQDAEQIGFVNELCPLDEVIERAEIQLKKYLETTPIIFSRVKLKLRKNWIAILEKELENLEEEFGEFWQRDEVQQNIQKFAERLK